jgi:hypothetical protein
MKAGVFTTRTGYLRFLAVEPDSKAQEVFIFKLDLISLLFQILKPQNEANIH